MLTRSSQRHAADPSATPAAVSPATAHEMGRERRPYRTFPDGSVEVETIVGTRRFDTMADAREFI